MSHDNDWEPDEPFNEDDFDDDRDFPEFCDGLEQDIADKFDVAVSVDVTNELDDEDDEWQMSVVLDYPTANQLRSVNAYVHQNAHIWLQEECYDAEYSDSFTNMYSLEVTVSANERGVQPKPQLRSVDDDWQ